MKKNLFSGLKFFTVLTGIGVMFFYCKTTFNESTGFVSSNTGAIIYAAIHVIVSGISTCFVDYFKRKPLAIFSIAGTGAALFGNAVFLYLKNCTDIDLQPISYVPFIFFLSYIILFTIGMQTVPTLIISEIFTINVKSSGFLFTTIYTDVLTVMITEFFHWSIHGYGVHVPFFVFAVCCFAGVVFFIFCVPETKGKTLEEIQLGLNTEVTNVEATKQYKYFNKVVVGCNLVI